MKLSRGGGGGGRVSAMTVTTVREDLKKKTIHQWQSGKLISRSRGRCFRDFSRSTEFDVAFSLLLKSKIATMMSL